MNFEKFFMESKELFWSFFLGKRDDEMQEQIGKNNGIVGMLFLIKNEYSYFLLFFKNYLQY